MKTIRIAQLWIDANLRGGHNALNKIVEDTPGAKRVWNLEDGEIYMFINRARTKIKFLASIGEWQCGDFYSYYDSPNGQPIDLDVRLNEILNSLGTHHGCKYEIDEGTKQKMLDKINKKRVYKRAA